MPVTKTRDNSGPLQKAVASLLKTSVVVGVTADSSGRDGDSGITNAAIAYVQEYGAPEKNIPARPFLIPGTEAAKDQVVLRMVKAGEAALTGDPTAVERGLSAVGQTAASAVQAKITDGPFAPLSQRTIEARARRTTKGTKGAKQYLKLQDHGTPDWALQSADLVKPLIDTGQLRRSITYAVRSK